MDDHILDQDDATEHAIPEEDERRQEPKGGCPGAGFLVKPPFFAYRSKYV